MPSDDDITLWISQLKQGHPQAAEEIWHRYFEQLVRKARHKLQSSPRRVADEEDVALSAFQSFYQGVDQRQFPDLNDRNDLWRILVTITARKAVAVLRRERRQKRGRGRVRGESGLIQDGDSNQENGFGQVLGMEPTPALAAQFAEECRRFLDSLTGDSLREVAVWRTEGWSVAEIAETLGCSTRTIERKLERIRNNWDQLASATTDRKTLG